MHYDDFIYTWNLCRTLAEVQELTGMSYRACIMRANRYRKIGYDMKCFTAKREIDRVNPNCPECGHEKKAHKYKFDGETLHCEVCTERNASCPSIERAKQDDRMWHGDPMHRMRVSEGER